MYLCVSYARASVPYFFPSNYTLPRAVNVELKSSPPPHDSFQLNESNIAIKGSNQDITTILNVMKSSQKRGDFFIVHPEDIET